MPARNEWARRYCLLGSVFGGAEWPLVEGLLVGGRSVSGLRLVLELMLASGLPSVSVLQPAAGLPLVGLQPAVP